MIEIKGTGSALLDVLQMKAAESSVLYNTKVSWSSSQSPPPPRILAKAAFGHGLCLSSTFLTAPGSWQGRSEEGGTGGELRHSLTARQQSWEFHPCRHSHLDFPCLAGGEGAFSNSREPDLPAAPKSHFHFTGLSG